ncbi:MAG TPA: prepilin-type N-terminal cleavage/methylation domain-containing protein [Candidatus Dormibacteraeota bacterium]|nr:prepilin-type N-terminal cleavage/methylation domain-containing protein [Candidatus Dormibacteraeota bacterium]
MRDEKGFTLIELLIVVAIIGIIAGIAVVQLQNAPKKARESVLKEDLYALRDCIDQYFADKGKYPESLETLVEENYLRKLPADPITGSSESWQVVHAEADDEDSTDPSATAGIIDVKSGAEGSALDGTRYSDW